MANAAEPTSMRAPILADGVTLSTSTLQLTADGRVDEQAGHALPREAALMLETLVLAPRDVRHTLATLDSTQETHEQAIGIGRVTTALVRNSSENMSHADKGLVIWKIIECWIVEHVEDELGATTF